MFKKAKKSIDDPAVLEVLLSKKYRFLYENFVVSTQHYVYFFLKKQGIKSLG